MNMSKVFFRWTVCAAAILMLLSGCGKKRKAEGPLEVAAGLPPVAFLAERIGGEAVKAADEGDSGMMVILNRISNDPYACGTKIKDVHKIANDEKRVPREWINKDGDYVTDEFIAYVRPLIQGDVAPFMVNGIPRHLYAPKELSLLRSDKKKTDVHGGEKKKPAEKAKK